MQDSKAAFAHSHVLWSLLILAVVLGAAFRLIWPEDMEYKTDETWTWQHVRGARTTGDVPAVGMVSSAKIVNPGMSLWVFIGLAKLVDAQSPPELLAGVGILNVLALVLLLIFARFVVPGEQREPWYWTIALFAVNPMVVLFQRKIWAQSVLPLFVVMMLIAWWYRRRFWGALAWGFLGALLGQIHMGGFLFALGIVLRTAFADRAAVSWRGWFLGSLIGAIGLIPWLSALWLQLQAPNPTEGMPRTRFWVDIWYIFATEPFGLGLHYSLWGEFWEFMLVPVISGVPTYGMGLLHGLILVIAVRLLVPAVAPLSSFPRRFWAAIMDRTTDTALIQNAAIWPYGLFIMLVLIQPFRHYAVIAHLFLILAMCRLALQIQGVRGRFWLAALVLIQALISLTWLCYIHTTTWHYGDYWMPYWYQIRTFGEPASIDM